MPVSSAAEQAELLGRIEDTLAALESNTCRARSGKRRLHE